MIALGLLLALFTLLSSAQDSVEGLPSVGSGHQCATEHGTCACSGNVVYGYGDRWSEPLLIHGSTQCSNHVFGDPYYGQVKVCMCTPSVVTSMEVRFTTSDSGDNCDNACEAIIEQCIEEMLFLQSAEEVASWALEVGVACSQILDRCDIGESPIFLEDNGVCTFCSNPNHPGWDNGNRCGAQWDIRQRICPCTSTLTESTSTTTPEESTTELPEEFVQGQSGTCDCADIHERAVPILSKEDCQFAVDSLGLANDRFRTVENPWGMVAWKTYMGGCFQWGNGGRFFYKDCSNGNCGTDCSGQLMICKIEETSEPSNIPSLSPITSSPSMHPSIVPSSTPSALPTNRPSVAPTIECAEGYELKQGDPMYGRGCRSEGISCIRRISAEECAAICSDSEHCVAIVYNQYHKKCVTLDTSVYYHFNVHIRGFRQNERTYCEKAHTTMRPFEPEAKFTTSEPGQSCKEACESIEEECRADMLFLQSAEEVTSWALAANVTCTSIVEKCSWAVAPLFYRNHPELPNNEVRCTFCSEPEPEWKYGAVCNARFGSDTRICPCSSTWSSAPTKTPTSSPTDLPTIQPSVSPTFSQPTAFPSMSPTLAGYEGSMCNVDDDCDSERCNFGEFPPRCRQKETHSSECNRDGDCESNLCLGLKCVDGRDNDRCNSNDDCQSGRCAYGIPFGNCQAPAEHGENCIRNNDCASQHCLLSTCTDHRDGAHCANDDDCLEGSSCVWSKTGATCKKNHGCTWWNWNECSEKCTWFQKVTFTCY